MTGCILRGLDDSELQSLRERAVAAKDAVNHWLSINFPQSGFILVEEITDAHVLDWFFYEIGYIPPQEFCVNNTCLIWSFILTDTCGFSLFYTGDHSDLQSLCLVNAEVDQIFLPYAEIVRWVYNEKGQSPLAKMWVDYVESVNRRVVVPKGWHPFTDILYHHEQCGWPDIVFDCAYDAYSSNPHVLSQLGERALSWSPPVDIEAVVSLIESTKLR